MCIYTYILYVNTTHIENVYRNTNKSITVMEFSLFHHCLLKHQCLGVRNVLTGSLVPSYGAVWGFYRPFTGGSWSLGTGLELLQPVLLAVCPLLPVCGHNVSHRLKLCHHVLPFMEDCVSQTEPR